MSVHTIMQKGNYGSAQTEDKYSDGIWADCPLSQIQSGELPGVIFEYNFDALPKTPATTEGNFGLFSQFSSTGGTIDAATDGRGWAFGADGDDEGASIRGRTTPFLIDRAAKKLWAEWGVKTSTIADTKHGIFLGLIEDVAFTATVPIAAAGTLSDNNFVGFHRLEGDGDYFDTVYKANGVTQVTVQADAAVIVADTYLKLGLVYEPADDIFLQDPNRSGGLRYNLFFYKDGLRLASYKNIPAAQGTDFPNDVRLAPFFAVLNATASTPGTSSIKRMRVAQLY